MVTKYDFFDGECHAQKGHGDYVKDEDYEALKADRDAQQKRADALAVENVELKASRETLAKNALETCNDVFSAGFRNASLQLGLMESTGNRDLYPNPIKALVDEAIRELTTPATSAALAAIEARGAIAAIESLIGKKKRALAEMHPDTHAYGATEVIIRNQIRDLKSFADELREAK